MMRSHCNRFSGWGAPRKKGTGTSRQSFLKGSGSCWARSQSPFFAHVMRSHYASNRRGFSLLEVILALAILTGAMVVLGQLARLGMENARIARDLTHAELLCESMLAEITSGAVLPDTVTGVPLETTADSDEADWLYSIDIMSADVEGLVAVRVSVVQDLPAEQRPLEFSLLRWIVDPGVELSEPEPSETDG